MHALLVTAGSSGDVFPFIAIARALIARGHRATILVNPHFEQAITEAGVAYRPLGKEAFDFTKMMQVRDAMHPSRGTITILREFIFPSVPEIMVETTRAIRSCKADVVVTHQICYGAAWAAQRHDVPVAKVALAPLGWFTANDPCVFNHWALENPSRLAMKAMLLIARPLMRFQFDRPLNIIRKDLRLPPAKHLIFSESLDGDTLLGMWSPAFRDDVAGDPAHGKICGFPWYDRPRHPDHDTAPLERFLAERESAGEPPIVFTLGTAVVHGAQRFYHDAAEACRILNRPGLLISGRPEFLPKPAELPKNVFACTYAPYSQVFPRAAAIVHHGGIGTTAQALRAGRPTVITPVAYDQFDNAARCKRLGLSQTVHFHRLTPRRLAEALGKVLNDPSYAARATAMGIALHAEDGAVIAADRIEQLCASPGLT